MFELIQWPPQTVPCPDCKQQMYFQATGLGERYYYQCLSESCKGRGPRQYARHPSLWCRHPEAYNVSNEIQDGVDVMFLLEDGGAQIPVIARCSTCRRVISGLYSKEATAGFVYKTVEDADWAEHKNDPTYSTTITCDQCHAKTI